MCVVRYIGMDDKDQDKIIVQWFGSTQIADYKGFDNKNWQPGWIGSKERLHYWRKIPLHQSHFPFTNESSGHVLKKSDVLMWRLPPINANGKLGKKTAKTAQDLRRLRET
jgi:hypothetical protein